jgi:DNA-binding LacI/PurR family transcriptional regulator
VISFALKHDGTEGPADQARQQGSTYGVTRARLAGYRRALTDAGLSWEQTPVYECPGSTPQLGHRAARHLLARTPRPTALLATSDALAIGALSAARELGLHTPAELSIAGFDDTAEAQTSDPPLTTVRQPHRAKGRRAGELILRLLDDDTPPPPTRLPAQLIIRASTAPPPRRSRQ